MLSHTDTLRVGEIYSVHHRWLRNWLALRLENRADADDLAQDTFTQLLKSCQRINATAIDEPRAYLTTLAKRIVVNWYKRRALEQAYLDALSTLPEAEAPSSEQRFIIIETLQEVDAMLDTLPPLARNTFLLSQLHGMKYDAIAAQLSISLSSVKRYMKKAFLGCLYLINEQEAGDAKAP